MGTMNGSPLAREKDAFPGHSLGSIVTGPFGRLLRYLPCAVRMSA